LAFGGQLQSGDSDLRERKSDGAEIFTIKDERHARYWMAQAFPVLLVIRNAEGEVRWMEVRDWLKRASDNGKKPVKQIVFAGERFDVMSVRRWRERVLGGKQQPGGRKKMAQRFIAGFPGREGNESRQGPKNAFTCRTISFGPPGLGRLVCRGPSDESLGYFRSSLAGLGGGCAAGRCSRYLPPVNAVWTRARASVMS
jgi:hypothetical protein